ncbi:hypothetical protein GGP41_009390 [Bipolaris sorokiniana]|uniref:Ankyrin n=1 Tax=Cochliobolus sativus TaxID=45130 RepID=A0A8H5ZCW2_COCSA|nr:hypothetical protein GGP41_009390 [Bipolaris sorokiniana]
MLLDEGANVNAQGGPFGNALQAASAEGRVQVVEMLLKGANTNAKGASEEGHEQVVKMLLDKGADANAQGGECGNALRVASARGLEPIVKMLLDAGAEINTQGGRVAVGTSPVEPSSSPL